MNRIYNKDTRLESYGWFTYFMWLVVIGFIVLIYNLSGSLLEKKDSIQANQIDEEEYLIPIDELRKQNSSKK